MSLENIKRDLLFEVDSQGVMLLGTYTTGDTTVLRVRAVQPVMNLGFANRIWELLVETDAERDKCHANILDLEGQISELKSHNRDLGAKLVERDKMAKKSQG